MGSWVRHVIARLSLRMMGFAFVCGYMLRGVGALYVGLVYVHNITNTQADRCDTSKDGHTSHNASSLPPSIRITVRIRDEKRREMCSDLQYYMPFVWCVCGHNCRLDL